MIDLKTIKFGWQHSLPDFRDRKFAFAPPAGDISTLPQEVRWRSKFPQIPIYNQGQTGSCVGQTGARVHHYEQFILGSLNPFKPSAMFLYDIARMARGGDAALQRDDGCQIRDMLWKSVIEGVCPESLWPFDPYMVRRKPTLDCYEAADKHKTLLYQSVNNTKVYDLLSALALGPLAGGISIFTSFMDAKNGDIPEPSGALEGGHAMTWTGYSIKQWKAFFDNSWGRWGNNGSGQISLDQLLSRDIASDFWALTDIE